jgi:mRNA interferase RelE/StbE
LWICRQEKRGLRNDESHAKIQTLKATLTEPEIVTRKGKPVSVIIPIKDYEELLERLEDSDDIASLKRARNKPLHYRPLEDYLSERRQNNQYRVLLERTAEKDLDRLSSEMHEHVIKAIRALATNPRPPGCRKLTGSKHDWRIRAGDCRVVYEIADEIRIVRVNRVRHRQEVFR